MLRLVVGRDGDVNKVKGRVGITESNDGDVNVGSFTDSLVIHSGVGDNDQARLFEGSGDVIGEVTGGETTSDLG